MTRNRILLIALGLNLLLLAVRIAFLGQDHYALYGDEAQYWTWAKALDWGYYSKPPMIAWAIAATTWAFGDGSFAVRLSSPIFHFGTALFIYAIAARFISERAALWASITYATLPAVTLSSMLASTDPALLFFWSAALYGLLRAEEQNQWRWWLFTGTAIGLGGLSKYSMLFFGASTLLYFYWQGTISTQLKNPRAWAGAVVAFLIYLPNLFWNVGNQFVSYSHTGDNAQGGGIGINVLPFLEFAGSQFGVFGPILMVALVMALIKRSGHWHAFILPMLLVMLGISLLSRAHANWAAPIYIAATLLVVQWLLETGRERWLKISLGLHVVVALLFMSFPVVTSALGVQVTHKTDPFRRLKGQTELAQAVTLAHQKFPQAKLIAEERRVVASLMYQLRDEANPESVYKWNPKGTIRGHYDLTRSIDDADKGQNFLMVARTDEVQKFKPYFRSVKRLETILIPLYPDYTLRYYVYLMKGFKGY